MKIQRHFYKAVLLAFVLSLTLVFITYYTIINRSVEREMEAQINHAVSLLALSTDFTLQTFVTDMRSLASRSAIRQELYRYSRGEINMNELKDFTQPKYADGAAVIGNLTGVCRVLPNGIIVSSFGYTEQLKQHDMTMPGIWLTGEDNSKVIIVEPIIELNTIVGFDAGLFSIGFLQEQKPKWIESFCIEPVFAIGIKPEFRKMVKATLPTLPFALVAEANTDLLQERRIKSLATIFGYSLGMLILIALIFYFTQFRVVRNIIERLTNSELLLETTQRIARAGGFDVDTQTRKVRFTSETFSVFDIPRGAALSPSRKIIVLTLRCLEKNDRKSLLNYISRCANEKRSFDLNYPITSVQGRKKCVRVILQPLNPKEKVSKVAGTIMDITDHKHAEEVFHEKYLI